SRTQKVAAKKACKPGCACCPPKAVASKSAPKKSAAKKAPGPRKAAPPARSAAPKKTARKASAKKPRKAASRPPVSAAAAGAQDERRGDEVRVWDGGPLERGVTYTTAEGKRALDKRRAEVRWSRSGAGAYSGVRAAGGADMPV